MSAAFTRKSGEFGGSSLNLIITGDVSKCGGVFQTSVWRIRAAAVCLGLLCFLLLILTFGLVAQSSRARGYWDQLHVSGLKYENLSSQWIQLQMNFNNLSESRDQLETKFSSLTEQRDALRNETEQLKIDANNLSESRDQLETKFNSLIEQRDALRNEKEQLKIDANNLSESRDQLETKFNSLTEQRDALRNETEQLKIDANKQAESRDQLETKFNSLIEERDALRNETEQLKIDANKQAESRDQLETKFNSLIEERDALRNETEKLKTDARNLTKEMEMLQSQYSSVAASHDALQKEVTKLNETVQLQLQPCPRGWVRFIAKCYYSSAKGEEKSWQSSKQDCENKRGRLAIITTKPEQYFVSSFHSESWIGLSDREQEGGWKWVDGTRLVGSGFWNEGEPNNANNGEDCAHTVRSQINAGGWNDNKCSTRFPYVCEA